MDAMGSLRAQVRSRRFWRRFAGYFLLYAGIFVLVRSINGAWRHDTAVGNTIVKIGLIASVMGLVVSFGREHTPRPKIDRASAAELQARGGRYYLGLAALSFVTGMLLSLFLLLAALIVLHFILRQPFPFFGYLRQLALLLAGLSAVLAGYSFIVDRANLRRHRNTRM